MALVFSLFLAKLKLKMIYTGLTETSHKNNVKVLKFVSIFVAF